MRRFLQQHRRSDQLILRAPKLTDEQLKEYAAESGHFQNVHKWVFCARVSAEHLEAYVYPNLSTHTPTLRLIDLSHNLIKGMLSQACSLCRRNLQEYSFLAELCPREGGLAAPTGSVLCPIHRLTESLQITTNTTIEVLKLRDNPIGGVGCLQLFIEFAQATETQIAVIDMTNCHIDDRVAIPLNGLLRKIPSNRKFLLKMNGNRMGFEGSLAISRKLPGNISLTLSKNRPRCRRKRTISAS
ncbi:hypothetical protein XU18_4444 [Perkinsela sp. CCAP 1560/4]|nr:hypothetical protein XU18_4444 [Perkinsela sp. CCAP 1560/4]|eukprot:KNH04234.1 hypothetical protein XU18_4444 [Perkinsela sp. CCAP 1560/4]